MTLRNRVQIVALLMPGLGLILVLIGSVVYIAFAQSFGYYAVLGQSAFSTDFWSEVLSKKLFTRAVRYSIYVGFWSAFFSVALAYPIAIWLRKPFPGSIGLGALLKAPLLVHGLVAAFLYINVISYNGLLNQFMQGIGIWNEPRRLQNDSNAFGVLLLQVWKNLPFALLLLTASLQGISDDVLDASRDLGAGRWSRFRKIIVPLSMAGMQAALVIIFIGALADFTFQTTVGPTNRQSMAQLMVSYKSRGDWHSAAVVGVSLMTIALLGSALLAFLTRVIMRRSLK